MDALKKSILGYQISNTRDVGPCILAMRMAFSKFRKFPGKALKFVADGYTAYKLAQQQFIGIFYFSRFDFLTDIFTSYFSYVTLHYPRRRYFCTGFAG